MMAATAAPAVDLTLLRAAIRLGADNGFILRRDRHHYLPTAGVLRWKAVRPTYGVVVLECWTHYPDQLDEERWKFRATANGIQVEIRDRLTLRKVLDALVLVGLLPETLSSVHALGVDGAANAIEEHAEAIGWYEGGGVWADAIERARTAAVTR